MECEIQCTNTCIAKYTDRKKFDGQNDLKQSPSGLAIIKQLEWSCRLENGFIHGGMEWVKFDVEPSAVILRDEKWA